MNVVILTPIQIEYDAVRKHLTGLTEKTVAGSCYETGQFAGRHHTFNITLHQTGSKNSPIALATEKAIQLFNPKIVLVTGIAGGVKDVGIGDVVVGTKAYGYEAGKETGDGFVARPEVVNYSKELLAAARSTARKNEWRKRCNINSSHAKVVFGPIASGDKVIATTGASIFPLIKKYYNDTTALEMEAIGFGQAMLYHPQILFLNIRGVSDLLENKSKTDAGGAQGLAAGNAAGFVFEMIYEMDVSQFKILKKDLKNTKDGQNVLADSPIHAGKNVHVGDVTHNVYNNAKEGVIPDASKGKKKGIWRLLETTLFKVVLVSVTLIGLTVSIDEFNFINCNNPSPIAGDTTVVKTPITEPVIEKPADNETTPKKENTAPVKIEIEKPVYILTINGNDSNLENITVAHLQKQFEKQDIRLSRNRDKANWEFRCQVGENQKIYDSGIRPIIMVSFTLKITLVNLSQGITKPVFNDKSKEFTLYDETEVPKYFRDWLNELDFDFSSIKQ